MKPIRTHYDSNDEDIRRAIAEFRGEQRCPRWFKMALILMVLIALGLVISAALAQTTYQQNAQVTVTTSTNSSNPTVRVLPAPPSTETVQSWIANINGWYAAALIIWTYLSHKFRDIMVWLKKAWPSIKSIYAAIAAHGGLRGIFDTLMFGIKTPAANSATGSKGSPE